MSTQALLFDSHTHLDDPQFDLDRDTLIQSLPAAGLYGCLTCGCDADSSRFCLELAQKYPFVHAAAGIHPHDAGKEKPGDLDQIKALLREKEVVAVGEIGIDHYYDFCPRDVQRSLLIRQMDLAFEMDLPVILHVRDAHGAMMEILRERKGRIPRGVMHCFSGSAETAEEYQALGFYISFSGSVTFKNAKKLVRAAQAVAKDRLMIETDCPSLSPEPYRGQRNDPGKVAFICAALAVIRKESYEEVARRSTDNACLLFGLPRPA